MVKKILVADDELPILHLVAETLQQNGYDVLIASEGYKVLSMALTEKPDLIVMDVKMPAGGGMSAYDNIRHSALTSSTPIIFITAHVNEALIKKVQEGFAVDYLAKPFSMGDLIAKIREMLKEE
jgi:DNA-binding response OmpR family regulator